MVLKLENNKISIKYSNRIEPLNSVYIRYEFEHNTEHLHPKLYFNDVLIQENNMFFVDLTKYDVINMRVDLYNNDSRITKIYTGTFYINKYCAVTDNNSITTNQELAQYSKEIASLNQQVVDLEEKGDII